MIPDPSTPFWRKVDFTDSCWLWRGYVKPNGYAATTHNKVRKYCHRIAYELLVGPIPDGLDLDHLCRVRHCVNPAHLEPVTRSENLVRSPLIRKSHCPQGHPYDQTVNSGRHLRCGTCHAAAQRRYKQRAKGQAR